jgi:hypothetical protein
LVWDERFVADNEPSPASSACSPPPRSADAHAGGRCSIAQTHSGAFSSTDPRGDGTSRASERRYRERTASNVGDLWYDNADSRLRWPNPAASASRSVVLTFGCGAAQGRGGDIPVAIRDVGPVAGDLEGSIRCGRNHDRDRDILDEWAKRPSCAGYSASHRRCVRRPRDRRLRADEQRWARRGDRRAAIRRWRGWLVVRYRNHSVSPTGYGWTCSCPKKGTCTCPT